MEMLRADFYLTFIFVSVKSSGIVEVSKVFVGNYACDSWNSSIVKLNK